MINNSQFKRFNKKTGILKSEFPFSIFSKRTFIQQKHLRNDSLFTMNDFEKIEQIKNDLIFETYLCK
jgi:hypothetical protein